MANYQYPAVIAHHFGTWEGKSTHFDMEGKVVDSYNTKIEMGAKGEKYCQRNTYSRDGQAFLVTEVFGGFDSSGKLTIEAPNFKGECTLINDSTLVFSMYTLSESGQPQTGHQVTTLCGEDKKMRTRTTQFVLDGMPYRISNIVEHLVSKDDVYFEEKKTDI